MIRLPGNVELAAASGERAKHSLSAIHLHWLVNYCSVSDMQASELTIYMCCQSGWEMYPFNLLYRIAGKLGRELNLAVWRFAPTTVKLKSANISYTHICIWRSRTKPPNLNPPIFSLELILGDPPNLIPAKFSSYTVIPYVSDHAYACSTVVYLSTNCGFSR